MTCAWSLLKQSAIVSCFYKCALWCKVIMTQGSLLLTSVGCLNKFRELSVKGTLSDGLTAIEFISAGENVWAMSDRIDGWLWLTWRVLRNDECGRHCLTTLYRGPRASDGVHSHLSAAVVQWQALDLLIWKASPILRIAWGTWWPTRILKPSLQIFFIQNKMWLFSRWSFAYCGQIG